MYEGNPFAIIQMAYISRLFARIRTNIY